MGRLAIGFAMRGLVGGVSGVPAAQGRGRLNVEISADDGQKVMAHPVEARPERSGPSVADLEISELVEVKAPASAWA